MNKQFVDLDDIFNEIDYELSHLSSGKKPVNKNKAITKKPVNSLPTVNPLVQKTIFKSRYVQFKKWCSSIVYTYYPDDKRTGFDAAIARYLDMAELNQNNFKILEEQISKDLVEFKEKVTTANDAYLLGYKDALLFMNDVLKQTKVTRFQELANKIN